MAEEPHPEPSQAKTLSTLYRYVGTNYYTMERRRIRLFARTYHTGLTSDRRDTVAQTLH